MKKFLYGLIFVAIYFLWRPTLGMFFPEYNYSAISSIETSQAVADYLRANYKAEDFGIKTKGEEIEWKLKILREKDRFLGDLGFFIKKTKPEPKRNRHLYVKVNYRKLGEDSWTETQVAKKKIVLNVDETDKNKVTVSEAEW